MAYAAPYHPSTCACLMLAVKLLSLLDTDMLLTLAAIAVQH